MQLVENTHPALRQICQPAELNSDTFRLAKKLVAILKKTTGIGLAAPQIGSNLAVFIVDVSHKSQNNWTNPKEVLPTMLDGKSVALSEIRPLIVINPETETFGTLETRPEGCLSLPNIEVPVTRPTSVKLTYTGADGKKHKLETNGLLARVIQHEYDHLQGRLITDFQKTVAEPIPS